MLSWETRPDDAKIVDMDKTFTPDGLPCQVICKVQYLRNGEEVGVRTMKISPGWVNEYFPQLSGEEQTEKFLEVFAAIPDVPANVLAAVNAKVPEQAFRKVWR